MILGRSTLSELEHDPDIDSLDDDVVWDANEHNVEGNMQSIDLESLLSDFSLESLHAFLANLNTNSEQAPMIGDVSEDYALPMSAHHRVDRDYQFSVPEIRLYALASRFCWTESETKEVLRLLKDPSFDLRLIGSDIDARVCTLLIIFLSFFRIYSYYQSLIFVIFRSFS